MPPVLLTFGIIVAAATFIDFLLGWGGDKRLRRGLVSFYVSIEEGDWTTLYRSPAAAINGAMGRFLGTRPLTLRYFARSAVISVVLTSILYVAGLLSAYVHALLNERTCVVPGPGQFLQIPAFMSEFLICIFVINIAVDYLSWALTQSLLRILANTKSLAAAGVFAAALCYVFVIVFLMYLVYLPLSIMIEAWSFENSIWSLPNLLELCGPTDQVYFPYFRFQITSSI